MLSWWNGIHASLRSLWEKSLVGSSPTDNTNIRVTQWTECMSSKHEVVSSSLTFDAD